MGKNYKFYGFYVVNTFPTTKKIYPLDTQRKKRLTNWYILVYSVLKFSESENYLRRKRL